MINDSLSPEYEPCNLRGIKIKDQESYLIDETLIISGIISTFFFFFKYTIIPYHAELSRHYTIQFTNPKYMLMLLFLILCQQQEELKYNMDPNPFIGLSD